jgi:hypothetical protein
MFVPARALGALGEKSAQFRRNLADNSASLKGYEAAWEQLARMGMSEIEERLGGVPWPGARPSRELDRRGRVVPFDIHWSTAQEARGWALETLSGVTTVAVDGSQVPPSKEFAVPIALVQVAWFENYHDGERPYIKDVRNEVLVPDDAEYDISSYGESVLSQRRFVMEMEAAVERIRSLAEAVQRATPGVVFIDGTFVLSFAGRMAPAVRQTYLRALFSLLEASEEHRVPVIGYVDLSFASDLTSMVREIFDLPAGNVVDAQMVASSLPPFDRTPAFRCARGDVLPFYVGEARDHSEDLYFLYMTTGFDRLPARIDVPRWVVEEDGLLDRVLDVVRAEIIVGAGYPYPIETADAAAVLTGEDRIAFYRLFHEFARAEGLYTALPAKSISKVHRR